jgi:hypothetical protein
MNLLCILLLAVYLNTSEIQSINSGEVSIEIIKTPSEASNLSTKIQRSEIAQKGRQKSKYLERQQDEVTAVTDKPLNPGVVGGISSNVFGFMTSMMGGFTQIFTQMMGIMGSMLLSMIA